MSVCPEKEAQPARLLRMQVWRERGGGGCKSGTEIFAIASISRSRWASEKGHEGGANSSICGAPLLPELQERSIEVGKEESCGSESQPCGSMGRVRPSKPMGSSVGLLSETGCHPLDKPGKCIHLHLLPTFP
jgi:hypothetical protein